MNAVTRRIAVNVGGGFTPGLNAVLKGIVLAAEELGWHVVGIRDGFDGLLLPECYREEGLVELTPKIIENCSADGSPILGNATRTDPFRVRHINGENFVEEVDKSGDLLARIAAEKIDAVISIVGPQAMSVVFRLHRQGLRSVCVPTSVENDVAATHLSFGFNTALSFLVDIIERAGEAAQSARKIGVIEVPGEQAGWLALQAGIANCADAVLIPEIPYDLNKVAAKLKRKLKAGRAHCLVVAAEGAMPASGSQIAPSAEHPLKASLSPGATGEAGSHVIQRSGQVAETVALELQRLINYETYPLVVGQLIKGGSPTAVDRQLGIGYGAAAIRAVRENKCGTMVAFQPPDLKFIPLAEAINRIRTVPADSVFVQIARSLGIALGD